MKRTLFMLAVVAMLVACGNSREEEIKAIEQYEMQLSTLDVTDDDANAEQLLKLYRKFAANYPDDSLAPVYMMRAADLCINTDRPMDGVALIDSIAELYPSFDDIAGCYFLRGYAFEMADMYDEAREAYTYFADTYPDHYLAEDARRSLPYIGMSPEEMFDAIMNAVSDDNIAME